jgi:hypothetical protein
MALNSRIRTLKRSQKRFDVTEQQDRNHQGHPVSVLMSLNVTIRTLKSCRKLFDGTEPPGMESSRAIETGLIPPNAKISQATSKKKSLKPFCRTLIFDSPLYF